MYMPTEQIQKILDDAPDGATHYAVLQYDFIEVYLRNESCCMHTQNKDGDGWDYHEDLDMHGFHEIESLDYLRENLQLRKETNALKEQVEQLTAALSLAEQMFIDYEMDVDCPVPIEHRLKMATMRDAMAKRDDELRVQSVKDFYAWLIERVPNCGLVGLGDLKQTCIPEFISQVIHKAVKVE